MSQRTRSNLLLPTGVILTILGVTSLSWYISRDREFQFGEVGPELAGAPVPSEAEADSTSNTIEAMRGQMQIVEDTVNERVEQTLAASEALQDEVKRLSEEREAQQAALRDLAAQELESQKARNAELSARIEELTSALLTRLQEVETRVVKQEQISLQLPIGDEAEEPSFESGERIAATALNDIVWLAPLDESAFSIAGTDGESKSAGNPVAAGVSQLKTAGGLLTSTNAGAVNAGGAGQGGVAGRINPNVRASLVEAERQAVQNSESRRLAAMLAPEPTTVPVYTLPDLSIGFDSSALTALVGRVYLDEDEITNPYEFKLVLGRDNVAANGQNLPDEIQGMFFEGYAVGDRLLSCVRGTITAASFLFSDGTVVPAYIGEPGSRPENDAYPRNRLGYITDPRGNCVPGQFVTDAPKWLAANALLAGAQGYARALREQEIERASVVDGSGVAVIENFTGDAARFAGASALVGGIDVFNDYASERLGEVFEAVYVPPGHPVVVHLQQELRLDRKPDARKITYPPHGGQANAYLD